MASVNLPLDRQGGSTPAAFNPSHRSVAYRREAIEAVGGYPEWLPIGEDMWVDLRWRELGMDMRFAPEAVVRWGLREGLGATWHQYFRYARGDAQAGMHPERHALRFGAYAALARRRHLAQDLAEDGRRGGRDRVHAGTRASGPRASANPRESAWPRRSPYRR